MEKSAWLKVQFASRGSQQKALILYGPCMPFPSQPTEALYLSPARPLSRNAFAHSIIQPYFSFKSGPILYALTERVEEHSIV